MPDIELALPGAVAAEKLTILGATGAVDREVALRELVRSRFEALGPVTGEVLARPFGVLADGSGALVAFAGVPCGSRYRMIAVVVKPRDSRWVIVTAFFPRRIPGGPRLLAVSREAFAEVLETPVLTRRSQVARRVTA